MKIEVNSKKNRFSPATDIKKSANPTLIDEPMHKISRQVLAWCLKYPNLWTEVLTSLKIEALRPIALQGIFNKFLNAARAKGVNKFTIEDGEIIGKTFTKEDDIRELFLAELMRNSMFEQEVGEDQETIEMVREIVIGLVKRINMWYTLERRQYLAREMELAERKGDFERIQELQNTLNNLLSN